MIFAGLLTMLVLRISPARGLKAYVDTYRELKWAIVTVMAVLALAYVLNQSGMTSHLGRLLAETGGFFAFLSPILGWIRSEEHTSEFQSRQYLVCRLLLE